jgi:hypothetical protein
VHCSYDFLSREREVAALRTLTPEDVRTWFAEHLGVRSPMRRKLAIHVQPQAAGCPAAAASLPAMLPTLHCRGSGMNNGHEREGSDSTVLSGPHSQGAAREEAGVGPQKLAGKLWRVLDLATFKSSQPEWQLPVAAVCL